MNIFSEYRQHIITVLNRMVDNDELPNGCNFDAVTAEPPRDLSHGDIATNAAMVVAKKAAKKPRDIAEIIKKHLMDDVANIASIDIAGPGFINIHLEQSSWHNIVKNILRDGIGYGNSTIGAGRKINIEYVSANPTGPMHIGHARGAVVGDVLSSLLLKAGYDVTKEYYINDAGGQIDVLAQSAYLRYREALGQDIGEIPEGLYPGAYLKNIGESFAQLHEGDYLDVAQDIWLPIMRDFALEAMMVLIKHDLSDLGIIHDVFTSEKQVAGADEVDNAIKTLSDAGLVYRGVLEPPKGKLPDDWQAREQLLFKSTEFGDDVDRALKKSDDSSTYFASDIAYHADKISRGYNEMVIALGADHGGYVKRLKAAVSALSNRAANIDVVLYQLVNFFDNGKALKMSKRAGTYVTVRDVVDAVGKDVVRFIMLTRKAEAVFDFDMAKVTEQSKDNPVFYVQYAHARICSVLRKAADVLPSDVNIADIIAHESNLSALNQSHLGESKLGLSELDLSNLTDIHEISLMKIMAQWPRIVEKSADTKEPHRVAFYLQSLAAEFHALWHAGNENISLRFIIDDNKNLTISRLALLKSCAITIASGLQVMGIKPVKQM